MKESHRLTFYVWPVLAIIILFSLLAGLLLLANRKSPPPGPAANVPVFKYAAKSDKIPMATNKQPMEIRALYVSDLFASSKDSRFATPRPASNQPTQTDITPPAVSLPLPAADNKTGETTSVISRTLENTEIELPFQLHVKHSAYQAAQKPLLSIALQGELKHLVIEPDIFRDIPPPAEQTPWSIQAELRVNNAGQVDHVLAESADCAPALYREIVRRLYQCRFNNVTRACAGRIVISYPKYAAVNQSNLTAAVKQLSSE